MITLYTGAKVGLDVNGENADFFVPIVPVVPTTTMDNNEYITAVPTRPVCHHVTTKGKRRKNQYKPNNDSPSSSDSSSAQMCRSTSDDTDEPQQQRHEPQKHQRIKRASVPHYDAPSKIVPLRTRSLRTKFHRYGNPISMNQLALNPIAMNPVALNSVALNPFRLPKKRRKYQADVPIKCKSREEALLKEVEELRYQMSEMGRQIDSLKTTIDSRPGPGVSRVSGPEGGREGRKIPLSRPCDIEGEGKRENEKESIKEILKIYCMKKLQQGPNESAGSEEH